MFTPVFIGKNEGKEKRKINKRWMAVPESFSFRVSNGYN